MNGLYNTMNVNNFNLTESDMFIPSPEQRQICDEVKKGGNHAIFGEAGTGKTALIRLIVNELKAMGKRVLCIAPTGIATQNLSIPGAMTIHRAFHLPDSKVEDAVTPYVKYNIFFDTLIIDEISMVRSDVFTTVDRLLRNGGNPLLPFGGVQLIVVGDFMQMPPFAENATLGEYIYRTFGTLFCFHTDSWFQTDFIIHKLSIGYRQAEDSKFFQYLHAIHSNSISQCELAHLNDTLLVNGMPSDDMPDCQLTLTKEDARGINQSWLYGLSGELKSFSAIVEGYYPEDEFPVDAVMTLKTGEKVLLTTNCYEKGRLVFANGDFGTFLDAGCNGLHVRLEKDGRDVWVSQNTWYHYEYEMVNNWLSSIAKGCFIQYPVLPGYAVTVNRAQGMTLTGRIHIKLPLNLLYQNPLPSGVAYTALSRAKSLSQLSCNRMFEQRDFQPPCEVMTFMNRYQLW